jgi:hypothetical protein
LIYYRGFCLVAIICPIFMAGCTPRASHYDEPRHYGPKINLQDFMRNTAKYKGRLITLALRIDESPDRVQGKTLRDYIGREVAFATAGNQGERLRIVITIPASVSVPEAGQAETFSITFLCSRGMLQQGNEAKIIENPKP